MEIRLDVVRPAEGVFVLLSMILPAVIMHHPGFFCIINQRFVTKYDPYIIIFHDIDCYKAKLALIPCTFFLI